MAAETKEELIHDLGNILEVVEAIMAYERLSPDQVRACQEESHTRRLCQKAFPYLCG